MKLLFLRLLIASVVATSLAACASTGVIPGAAQQSVESGPTRAATRGSTPACGFTQVWHFDGPCKSFTMRKGFTSITLDEYRDLTVTIRWPAEHPPQLDNTFVTTEATGDGDVTGRFQGIKFPLYGSIHCEDPYFRKMPCPGKAFLYNILENESTFEIGWDTTPQFTIVNRHSFSGHKCQWGVLVKAAIGTVWQVYPAIAKPKNDTLVIEPWDSAVSLQSRGLAVETFLCSKSNG